MGGAPGGSWLPTKIRQGKIIFRVHGNFNRVGGAGLRQNDFAGREFCAGQIQAKLVRGFLEQRMPAAIVAEGPDAAQHAVGILLGRDVAEGEGVGREQRGQRGVAGVGQNHVAGAAHLPREIIVIFDEAAVGHLHRRMVGPQFVEEDVERGGFRALFGQFRDEPAIDFARPVEAEMKADLLGLIVVEGPFSRRRCWLPRWRRRRGWWRRARENGARSARANRRSSVPAAQKNPAPPAAGRKRARGRRRPEELARV